VFQFTTIYYRVDDEEKLESFFSSTHLPLAEQLPGLVKSEVSRITGKPGGESRFHLAYALFFSSEASFRLSMASGPGLKLIEALMPWADAGLIIWYYADAFEEVVKRAGPEVTVEDLLPGKKVANDLDAQSASSDDAAGI
jgi:uncharacterized protein (TIGR02118 family)